MKKIKVKHEQALSVLRESEKMMQYIIRNDPNIIAIFDANLHFMAVSERYLLDFNFKEENIIGRHYYDVFPGIPQKWKDIHQRCLKGKILHNDDQYLEQLDGTNRYNRWVCSPWCRINGEIGGMILYFATITERNIAETALRENEKKYRHLFSHNPQPMCIYDANSLAFIDVNNAAVKHYCYTRDEFLKMTLKDICPLEDIPILLKAIEQGEAYKNPDQGIRHIKKNGEVIYVEITAYAIEFNGVKAFHLLIKDITAHRLAEKAMHESEARYQALFENSLDGILLTSPEGSILSANKAACNMFGYSEEELIHIGRAGLVDKTDPRLPVLLAERRSKGKAQGETYFIRKDGSRINVEISSSLYINPEGLERSSMIVRDISEKKKTQKEIKFQADLLNNVGQAVIATDLQNSITYWNKAAEQIYGWSAQEIVGKNIMEFIPADFNQEKVKEINDKISKGQTWTNELIVKRKDGSSFLAQISNSPIFDEKGSLIGFIGISQDITERKRNEATLIKLSRAVEQAFDSVMITDRNGKIEYVNQAFEIVTGYTPEEVIGMTPRVLKSGMYSPNFYEDLWATILSGKVFRSELINKKKNGEYYYVEKTISPIVDQHNAITHFIGTSIDISERKQAEEELIKAKEKAEESDRLKSAFLANMSHEVRTPLNSIIGFSTLLSDPDFDQDQKDEFISHIIKNGNALMTVISDIVDISKIEAGEIKIQKREINLRKFISSIHQQYTFQLADKHLEFHLNLPTGEEETFLYTDPDRLHQIYTNLINNALKFTFQGKIEIGYQHKKHEIAFYVRDTGIGISKEYHEKIFERFIQVEQGNSRKYGGNGLGLAIVKNLVELMDGNIWLESEPDKGSVFYFTLPHKKE